MIRSLGRSSEVAPWRGLCRAAVRWGSKVKVGAGRVICRPQLMPVSLSSVDRGIRIALPIRTTGDIAFAEMAA